MGAQILGYFWPMYFGFRPPSLIHCWQRPSSICGDGSPLPTEFRGSPRMLTDAKIEIIRTEKIEFKVNFGSGTLDSGTAHKYIDVCFPAIYVEMVPHCPRKSTKAHGSLRKKAEAIIGIISPGGSNFRRISAQNLSPPAPTPAYFV